MRHRERGGPGGGPPPKFDRSAAMRLRVNDPTLLPDLLEFFESRGYAVASEVSEDEIEVSLLGSYAADAMRMELYLRDRAWEAGRRAAGVEVELID